MIISEMKTQISCVVSIITVIIMVSIVVIAAVAFAIVVYHQQRFLMK
jgi:hypothetical protein